MRNIMHLPMASLGWCEVIRDYIYWLLQGNFIAGTLNLSSIHQYYIWTDIFTDLGWFSDNNM